MAAGLVGSLTGMGGGVVIIPLLTLGFGVDIRYAIGASLVSVIATSSGAAAAYVKEGFTNLRIGMFLEMATASGALVGAFVATHVATNVLSLAFGAVLMFTILASGGAEARSKESAVESRLSKRLGMHGVYPSLDGPKRYTAHRVPLGFALMHVAGAISGLLGIGSGAFKVLAMDRVMRLPFKVSTTTSNFMIGVTAATSATVYLSKGYIDPGLSMPIVLGVLAGSFCGTRVLARTRSAKLKIVFNAVITVLSLQMIWRGLHG